VQLDVQMPADLDQFGGDNSHCTVIGGKGLVQLRHGPADGRTFFDQVDVIPGVGEGQGLLLSGDPTTDDHYRTDDIF